MMNTISNAPVHAILDTRSDLHPLTTVALFCGLVLGAALCLANYGLNLSAGFF